MLRAVSNAPPEVVPRATLVAVLGEAVREVLEQSVVATVGPRRIRYVVPRAGGCPDTDECLPLAPFLEGQTGDHPVAIGHLHRPVDRTGEAVADAVPLEVVGRLIAANVGRDLLDIRLARSEHDVANLRIALESSRVIGVAIGILMATRHCTAAEAFDLLKLASQNQNRKLRDVAAEVEFTGTVLRAAERDEQRA